MYMKYIIYIVYYIISTT